MPQLAQRLLPLLSVLSGAVLLWLAWQASGHAEAARQLVVIQALVGALLVTAPWMPAWQLPALIAGVLQHLSVLVAWGWSAGATGGVPWSAAVQALLLAGAAWMVWNELRREARWDGLVPARAQGR